VGSAHLSLVPDAARVGEGMAPEGDPPQRLKIVDGALRCIARQGIAKTTLDDVAREAGCSRATVYRVFPGGKESVLGAVVDTELARFYSALAVHLGDADNLEDVLVVGIAEGTAMIARHPALGYLLLHEPGVVLPYLTFAPMDALLAKAARMLAPFLGRFLDHDEAARVVEFATRIAVSYLSCPAAGTDITDRDDVRRLVRRFVLPGITPGAVTGAGESGDPAGRARAGTASSPKPSSANRKGEAS
jgi:AcrR family transcriptional regulator